MKKNKKTPAFLKMTTVSLLTLLISSSAFSQDSTSHRKRNYFIETDPSTFFSNGYAVVLKMREKPTSRLVYGIGAYSLDYPKFVVEFNSDDKDKGWKNRVNNAFLVQADYNIGKKTNRGLATGLVANLTNYKLTNENIPNASAHYAEIVLIPRISYTAYFSKKLKFYAMPWFGLSINSKISGEKKINSSEYKGSSFSPVLAVHLGYEF